MKAPASTQTRFTVVACIAFAVLLLATFAVIRLFVTSKLATRGGDVIGEFVQMMN